MKEIKTCPMCSKEFEVDTSRHPHQKLCSPTCRGRYLRSLGKPKQALIDKECIVCGSAFQVPRCFGDQRTCSKKCSGLLRRKKLVVTQCRQCKKEIRTLPSLVRPFCSRQCVRTFYSGPQHHAWVVDRTKQCAQCGETFEVDEGWKKSSKFCSAVCFKQYAKEHIVYGREVGTRMRRSKKKRGAYDGYVYIKVGRKQWRPEHRVLMEKKLGRPLTADEVVHHKNGNRADNRDENMIVVTRSQHMDIHREAELIGLSVQAANDWNPDIEGMAC
jgi:predicted nucleic acid-binding Zn ribbon protein